MQLDGLAHLDIQDDFFIWKKRKYLYQDIVSISFEAKRTKHSINFVPTGTSYESKLVVRTSEDAAYIGFSGRALFNHEPEREAMSNIWKAKEIISEMSFASRVAPIEKSYSEKGFFAYGNYQFHRDGSVFKSGKRLFSIKDNGIQLLISPFQLTMKPVKSGFAKFFNNGEVVDISSNEDCLLYMLRIAYGLSWNGHPVRTKQRPVIDGRKVFLTAIIKLAARIAKADGTVSSDEIHRLKSHFSITKENFPDGGRIFNEALNSTESPGEIAAAVRSAIKDNREFLEYIVLGLISIATADGNYDDKEHAIVETVARVLGFGTKDLEQLLAMSGVYRGKRMDDEEVNRKTPSSTLEDYHLRVLGLDLGATISEIRAAWMSLVREHHPDALIQKGVPVTEIKAAEEILKTINASYNWLSKFHAA